MSRREFNASRFLKVAAVTAFAGLSSTAVNAAGQLLHGAV